MVGSDYGVKLFGGWADAFYGWGLKNDQNTYFRALSVAESVLFWLGYRQGPSVAQDGSF